MKTKVVPFMGMGTAVITPFTTDGAVDYDTLPQLLNRQISAGAAALIMLGTTGEPSTLTGDEQDNILRLAREVVDKSTTADRPLLVAGVGGNNTNHCIERCKAAADLGADALLAVTPYYNKTSQAGLIAHFTALADSTDLPVIVYNVPSRTALNMTPDTMDILANHPRIAGLKEASSSIEQIVELFARVHNRVAIYSGSDDQNMVYMALGGEGVISVLSNLIPADIAKLCRECLANDIITARITSRLMHTLTKALFWDVSPIPLKAALAYSGLCEEYVRMPLVPMRDDLKAKLYTVIDNYTNID